MNYAEFKEEVDAIVMDAIEEVERDDSLEAYELINESVDGHQWIIYTIKSWDLVNFARNHSDIYESGCAEFDDLGFEATNPIDKTITQLAYCILFAACMNEYYEQTK